MYLSRVAVFRLGGGDFFDGAPTLGYQKLTDIVDWQLGIPGEMMCRIDLPFLRPGKQQPMATQAGVKPPRVGTLFFDPYLRPDNDLVGAGDYIQTISGPVHGIFELRIQPEGAFGFSGVDHMECEIVEVAKEVAGVFPVVDAIQAAQLRAASSDAASGTESQGH